MTFLRILASLALVASSVQATLSAQAPQVPVSIVGTWTLAAADKLLPDGTRADDYGANPHGLAIFTADGRYSISIYRADRTTFASNDRNTGTPAEYRDAVLGMSVHFGRYELDAQKGTIAFRVDRASFPNWDGTTRVAPFTLKGDELAWRSAARPDGSVPLTVLRRSR